MVEVEDRSPKNIEVTYENEIPDLDQIDKSSLKIGISLFKKESKGVKMSSKNEDKEIAMAAVQADGWQLENYPDFQDDADVVLCAVENTGAAVQFASDRLKSDKSIVLTAVKNDPYILDFVDEQFRDDEDIMAACSGE